MSHGGASGAQPCVWMTAGLVSYKLCDRDFDCDRCPLDAALRGGAVLSSGGSSPGDLGRHGEGFPDDRRYTAGHTWVASGPLVAPPAVRVGLDAFAAALLPGPLAIRCVGSQRELRQGDALCDIELPDGIISVGSPVAGHQVRGNPSLGDRPWLVVESPYGDGWLADLVPAEREVGPDGGLLTAEQARTRSGLDLKLFRRRVALHLLAEAAAVGPSMADGGEPLISLREILGGARYLETLREIIR